MPHKYNANLLDKARELRKNMTDEEKHLWYDFLQSYSPSFTRQKIIAKYITDFYCSKAKLAIELDGSEHYTEEGKKYDAERSELIEAFGVMVLRFSNLEIWENFEGVCSHIDRIVKNRIEK